MEGVNVESVRVEIFFLFNHARNRLIFCYIYLDSFGSALFL